MHKSMPTMNPLGHSGQVRFILANDNMLNQYKLLNASGWGSTALESTYFYTNLAVQDEPVLVDGPPMRL